MPTSVQAVEEVQPKKKFTFKLRSGMHDVIDPVTKTIRHMVPGDVINTDDDLKRIWDRKRWEKVDEDKDQDSIAELKARIRILEGLAEMSQKTEAAKEAEPIQDDLETMSVKQLREFAAKFEPSIDLSTCNGRQEILNTIREAMDAA